MLLEAKADVNMKNNVSESCSSDGVCALAESIVDCVYCQCYWVQAQASVNVQTKVSVYGNTYK